MEAVGLAASVAGLLQLTGGVLKLSYTYVSDVKTASEARKSYQQEVAALREVLFQFERALDSADTAALVANRATELDQLFTQCRQELSRAQSQLSKAPNHFTRLVLWPLKSKELKGQVEGIHRLRSILADFVSSTVLVATSRIQAPIRAFTVAQERAQLLSILPDHRDLSLTRPIPCPGTGRWFIDSDQFQTWLGQDGGLLWCHGPPGVGKSLLASAAVEHLLEQQKQQKLYLCHFFCDYTSRDRQTTVAILQSLTSQLIGQADAELLAEASTHLAVLDTSNNPENLVKFMAKTACRPGSKMVVVLDAEDEMKRNEAVVDHLLDLSSRGCHVLITSRMAKDFAGDDAKSRTTMAIDVNAADIEKYVKHRLGPLRLATGAMDALMPGVVDKSNGLFLLSKLLVDQLSELPTVAEMLQFLQSATKDLDQAMETTWTRINAQSPALRRLAHRTLGWVLNAKRPLRIDELLHAFAVQDDTQDTIHPYSLSTSQHIVQSCAGFVTIDERGTVRLAHASIYAFCHGQLEATTPQINNDITQTCLRYLGLQPMSLGPCISLDDFLARTTSMPFLLYATKNLASHTAPTPSTHPLLLPLLLHPPTLQSTWQALLSDLTQIKTPSIAHTVFASLPTRPSPLHLAAYFNLAATAHHLLTHLHHPPSPLDSQSWTPLHWAAAKGSTETAAALLASGGAEAVDARDSEGWTALFWASFEGHEGAVRALLAAGADHRARGGASRWTALHWAVASDQMAVVKVLVGWDRKVREAGEATVVGDGGDRAAGDESRNYYYGRWFRRVDVKTVEGWKVPPPGPDALGMEFFDAVAERLDLEPVAGRGGGHAVFVSGVKGMKGMRAGCERGDLRAFQPLVSKVAWRMNRKVGTVGTVGRGDLVSNRPALWKEILLQSAVAASNLFAAQLLVELGADVNLCDRDVPFLESAVRHRDHRFLELLLSSGVEARSLLGDHFLGGSVLHAAVSPWSKATEATFSCLVRYGANINTRGYRGTTALMVAARDLDDFQATAWTNTLLSCGASLELESDDGWNALDYACDTENLLCAEQLLRRGARPTRPPKLRENDVSWWYRVRPERVRRVLDLFARYDAGTLADVASQVAKESGENYVTMALRTWDWDVIDFLVSVGGHVPSNARIQNAVYRAIAEVGESRVVGKGIKLVTDGGARLDPDDPAVLILLEKYERLARGDRKAWQETYEKECCQLITLLVSAGCRLDLQLAEAPDDCGPYTVEGGDGTRYIVTKGEEGGKTALFLAEKWLGSEMVVNTIVDLLERSEQQPS